MRPASALTEIKKALAALKVPRVWKSLDELMQTEEYRRYRAEEYPHGAHPSGGPITRRDFFKTMGASILMAQLAGCARQPEEDIVPYVRSVEEIVPGKPLFFATSLLWHGHYTGVLVTSHMGRPTHIQGNRLHPDSLGAASVFHQAALMDLYDPARSKAVLFQNQRSDWRKFVEEMDEDRAVFDTNGGNGLRLLTETRPSPTLQDQIRRFLERYPNAKWHTHDPLASTEPVMAQQAVFGRPLDTVYHFDKAKIVVSLDSDFMGQAPGHLRHARHFMEGRKTPSSETMSRFYAAEPTVTVTGSMADHRLPASYRKVLLLAEHLAKAVGVSVETSPADGLSAEERQWVSAAAQDLKTNREKGLVIAGAHQPAWVHTLVYWMNETLGNLGRTMRLIEPIRGTTPAASLEELVADIRQNDVRSLIILGGNPAYTAPSDLSFAELMPRVVRTVHLSTHVNETSKLARWHVNEAHELESFSDGRALDGTICFAQPLIKPLYDGKSAHELMALLSGDGELTSYQVVRRYWSSQWNALELEHRWKKALHDGVLENSASEPVRPSIEKRLSRKGLMGSVPSGPSGSLEVLFRPDPSVWDGRYANNAWLQELPKPFSKLTWGNAALVCPALAESMGLDNGSVVRLAVNNTTIEAPVWIAPGQAPDTLVLPLGYGRKAAGPVGNRVGFDAYPSRTSKNPDMDLASSITKTGKKRRLASTQNHHSMEGRELVRWTTMEKFLEDPAFAQGEHAAANASLYPPAPKGDYAWGMVINLNACIGCNACVIGCQSENNIPVVGVKEVQRGREMHWLRIDNYYEGTLEAPQVHHQPVPCMHCENAPCEPVCPVGATNHSDEGLNQMVYNRCVGTKYCSNNCPYKVRHFNFFEYADRHQEELKLMRNPDVTVRARGVMEKCTFCVQRINHARIDAKKEGRAIGGDEIVTACQAACPTQAIIFGDIQNPQSQVHTMKKNELNYTILDELGVKPRVSYHAKVKNAHPWIGEHNHAAD